MVVLGIYSYNTYVMAPQEQEAQEKIFMAQKYLEQDSLQLALTGDSKAVLDCVPIQGSGTFAVEAMLGTFVPAGGHVLSWRTWGP